MIPLKLADGRLVNTENGKVMDSDLVVVPTVAESVRDQRVAVQRKLIDLPAPSKQSNIISIIVAYTLFGLSDEDISIATGLSISQVGNIKVTDAYSRMYNCVVDSVIEKDRDDIRGLIQRGSINAANRMLTLVQDESPNIALAASKDILDRAGHRPADVVEHRHKVEGGLTIEYIRKDKEEDIPMIDVLVEDEELF